MHSWSSTVRSRGRRRSNKTDLQRPRPSVRSNPLALITAAANMEAIRVFIE